MTAATVPEYFNHSRPELVALAAPSGKRILDVGCAAGAMGAALLAAGAEEVVGLELDAKASSVARTRLSAVYGADASLAPELPYPDGYFDLVTFADVLEHLPNPAAVLRHFSRYLQAQGQFLLSLPNVRHESVLLPLLLHGRWDYAEAGILDKTHLRFFTRSGLLVLLAEAGLEVEGEVSALRTPPNPALEALLPAVSALGGEAESLRDEASVMQYLVAARPRGLRKLERPVGFEALWKGAHPVRLLLAPAAGTCAAALTPLLQGLAAALCGASTTTVGLAVSAATLESFAPAVRALASRGLDLRLWTAPEEPKAWQRLLASASVLLVTSESAQTLALARGVGLELHRG